MQLKNYQQRSLDVLGKYFQKCKETGDSADAFYFTTKELESEGRKYYHVDELPGLPYVCLRVPTRGGKKECGNKPFLTIRCGRRRKQLSGAVGMPAK